jgi:hypothetical protein
MEEFSNKETALCAIEGDLLNPCFLGHVSYDTVGTSIQHRAKAIIPGHLSGNSSDKEGALKSKNIGKTSTPSEF